MPAHEHPYPHPHPPPSPNPHPAKRPRPSSPDEDSPPSAPTSAVGGAPSPSSEFTHDGLAGFNNNNNTASSSAAASVYGGISGSAANKLIGQASSFRNVSACNRCRLRKNRCDQRLPSCVSCEKASVACVGYDPITKKEIPRSYVFYLETRIKQLETLLQSNGISFPPAQNLEFCSRVSNDSSVAVSPGDGPSRPSQPDASAHDATGAAAAANAHPARRSHQHHHQSNGDGPSKLQKLVSKTVPGSSNPRYLGSMAGVSFARVVFAAVQSSVSDQRSNSDKGGVRPYNKPLPSLTGSNGAGMGTSMRDSFFGLHTKPTIHPATFPDRKLAMRLVELYFQHANPQIPVLHRGDFMRMFDHAFADEGQRVRGPRELYVLNMVFAIGGGIILAESKAPPPPPPQVGDKSGGSGGHHKNNSQGGTNDNESRQCQAEEYHASAIVHLEACLSSGGGLEELQAVLLLANFALLRPVPPGLWYIVGVAVRLAIDLGLQYEDGKNPQDGLAEPETADRERGRREYVRDQRRRLWWCTYSLDRLVSICVGRPFGVSDQVITTEFPSLLEDKYITPQGGLQDPGLNPGEPTYKLVAQHYFRLRLLQSEILQVLQFQQAQLARQGGQNQNNPYMHTQLPSPFLARFDNSFRSWRIDIDKRLYQWKIDAPSRDQTGVEFSTDFLDLNYWQAIIMLYRQSLSVPAMFEGEYNTSKEINSPSVVNIELQEDEERVYLKVAEAGQRILRLYRQLHIAGVVNYTYLATHHLFMAGISYLYAIWHSPIVRSRLTGEEVDFTILAANSVFSDLSDKCPPAEACRDAFDRTAKATVKMAASTGGFGPLQQSHGGGHRSSSRNSADYSNSRATTATDWAARSDTSSQRSMQRHSHQQQHRQHHHRAQHHHRRSFELGNPNSQAQSQSHRSDTAYSIAATSPPIQSLGNPQFRLATLPDIKSDPSGSDANPFGLSRTMTAQAPAPQHQNPPHSAASNSSVAGTPDSTGLDPNVMASPTFTPAQQQQQQPHVASPTASVGNVINSPGPVTPLTTMSSSNIDGFMAQQPASTTPQGQPTPSFTSSMLNFSDMQGIDFLQSLGPSSSAAADPAAAAADAQMDLGFGLGWEGVHHDFSDGQQVDLFEGFFFDRPQGGGAGGGGGIL